MNPAPEVYKAQELVYELKIGEVMIRRLITVAPGTQHARVQESDAR